MLVPPRSQRIHRYLPSIAPHQQHKACQIAYLMPPSPGGRPQMHPLLGLLTVPVGSDGIMVSTDKYNLTPRELQVLELLTKGVSNAEISHRLLIKPTTVKRH